MSTQSKPSTPVVVPTKTLGTRPKSAFVAPKDCGAAAAKPVGPMRRELDRKVADRKGGGSPRRENTPQARNEANLQSVSELAYVKKQVSTLKTQLDELGFKNLELAEAIKTKDAKIAELETQVEKLKNQ